MLHYITNVSEKDQLKSFWKQNPDQEYGEYSLKDIPMAARPQPDRIHRGKHSYTVKTAVRDPGDEMREVLVDVLTESKGILCEKSSANRTLRPNHVEKIRWPKGSVECHYGPSPLWRGPIKVFDHGPAFVPAQERTHCAFMFQFNLLFWYW